MLYLTPHSILEISSRACETLFSTNENKYNQLFSFPANEDLKYRAVNAVSGLGICCWINNSFQVIYHYFLCTFKDCTIIVCHFPSLWVAAASEGNALEYQLGKTWLSPGEAVGVLFSKVLYFCGTLVWLAKCNCRFCALPESCYINQSNK